MNSSMIQQPDSPHLRLSNVSEWNRMECQRIPSRSLNSPTHNSLNSGHARNLFCAIQLDLTTNSQGQIQKESVLFSHLRVFSRQLHIVSPALQSHLNVTGSYAALYSASSGSLSRQQSLETSSLSTQIDTGGTPAVSFYDRDGKPGFQGAPLTLALVLEYSIRESNYEKTLRDKAPKRKSTTQDGSQVGSQTNTTNRESHNPPASWLAPAHPLPFGCLQRLRVLYSHALTQFWPY